MKVVAQLKLLPSPEQAQALKKTMEVANHACNVISETAWNSKVFNKRKLQKVLYYEVREDTDLSAQVVIRCISKVSDAYKASRKVQRRFKKHGSIAYDSRILKFYQEKQVVSIWTYGLGRAIIPYQAGKRQLRFLQHQAGETDLVHRNGAWFLLTCCDVVEPKIEEVQDVLGLDLGVTNIVVTSDESRVSSEVIEPTRIWYHNRRKLLQSVGTKSAKRRLKQLSGRQRRFQRDVNHRISKELVVLAKRTNRGLALEDLKGINTRTRVRGRDNRNRRMNWSFFQLRAFIEYKARGLGVPVILVDPAYTSQMCSSCGHVAKANRPTQDQFKCVSCGFEIHADKNAARNIRDRGIMMINKGQCQQPYGSGRKTSYKLPSLGGRS